MLKHKTSEAKTETRNRNNKLAGDAKTKRMLGCRNKQQAKEMKQKQTKFF
jgi:hypothetical protein